MTFSGLRIAACVLLLHAASVAIAAPGFVTGLKVTRGNQIAEISIQFACSVEYVSHLPTGRGDKLRIQIESTAVCNGVSPLVSGGREQHRPIDADLAKLLEIDYDGETAAGQVLTLAFTEAVRFDVANNGTSNDMSIRVYLEQETVASRPASNAAGVRVQKPAEARPEYVINLSSSRRPHAASEAPDLNISPDLKVFESEVLVSGTTWYRLRLGNFNELQDAEAALAKTLEQFPTAWIDQVSVSPSDSAQDRTTTENADSATVEPANAIAAVGLDELDKLMADARKAVVAGEISRAVQIYTKVLRIPGHDRHAEAQEYLALAREKNGQMAHAKAEYQRYLELYPNGDGASRVNQRLAALLATDRKARKPERNETNSVTSARSAPSKSDWRIQTFFSQYYRRDVNQINEEDEIVSQSAIYSDVNLDARRRGARFDFSSRLSAGYRNDLLDQGVGSGNELRVSYAYADLADAETGLRGRIGRQSRNTGGILGRFDGLNLGYQASERVLLNSVVGQPVNSASDDVGSERTFYGASVNYGPIIENLELGLFFVQQNIEDVEDRRAVGTEIRYFGTNQSLWGLIDYDTSFGDISSAFLQGSWRFGSHSSIHGSFDRRYSPYLSTGNAQIGQPVQNFAEMLVFFSEEEIRQLSLDRSPQTTSYTLGVSHSISPRLQINADGNQTSIDATPESGGVAATPFATYRYFSTSLVVSSIFKEGDVSMIGLRASDSDSTKVLSLNLDSRFPFGRTWRINPRLRVDRRQIMSDQSTEWLYTPGIRIQLRHSQKYRVELEAGKQFSQRDSDIIDFDRESYYVNVGYQAFF